MTTTTLSPCALRVNNVTEGMLDLGYSFFITFLAHLYIIFYLIIKQIIVIFVLSVTTL